jgi:serine/threonine-protein kinase RsbW
MRADPLFISTGKAAGGDPATAHPSGQDEVTFMHMPDPEAAAPRTTSAIYPGDPEHVRAVRADLRQLLGGHPLSDDAILCASELASNAIRHSHSGQPGGKFTVSAELSPDGSVHVEVQDDGGPWTPATPETARHGLDILHALAANWGIDGDYRTRTVWVQLDGSAPRYQALNTGIGCPPGGEPVMPDASATYAIASAKHVRGAHRWTAILDGPRLRHLRHLNGFSREKLADQAGLSFATVARLERQPTPACRCRTLVLLAAALREHPAAITRGFTHPN